MYTKVFQKISKKDTDIAGGKGASLGEMFKAKMQVPPGFVVLAFAFDKFIKTNDLETKISTIIYNVNYKDVNAVNKASESIRKIIISAEMSKEISNEIKKEFKQLRSNFVAVRSSATAEDSSAASWAGELESYLYITEKNLLEAVKKCWSSLFTPRAIFYRYEKKLLKKKVSVAVVVQKMVESEVSGICFTVHPVTKNKNEMIIEAGWGLGEAIVSGQITPDSYVINKKSLSIEDINISEQVMMIIRSGISGTKNCKVPKSNQDKQKLSGKQIIELAKMCLNIEKHYKFPCDIEWALEKGKLFITQSRPITTL